MRSTFKVLFYVKKGSEKPNGNLPLMCRITVDGEIKQFSCKMDVPLRLWDVKNNRASGKSAEAQRINRAVDKIRVEINRRYQELMQTDGYVTAAKLKDAYLGIGIKQETLLKLFEQHNSEFAKKVGHSRAKGTFRRYVTVCKHIREFLPHTYKREDIPLKELNLSFINDFEYFLRTEKKCRTNTIWGYMIVLKHIISIARNDGRLPFNPFAGYINSPESVDRGYITREEIHTMMNTDMPDKTHELVRDLFLFSTFTGLAYSDVKNLTEDNLQTFFDGNLWIITRRKKTNTESNIRLLDVPRKIIEKYRWKIQCKLPPKTKRFCPLKTFNNAPLKSLDRWGYYYFSLFPSVCSHFTDTFSCQLNPVRRMYNTIHNGICYCRVSDCIIPIVRWQLRGDDDGLAPMSVLYYIEQDGSFLGIKVHKEEVIQYEQRAPFDSLEFRFQCAFYFCHLKRTHKFRSIRIICPYALLAGFIPHCCGKEALPGTG
jgi:integrase